MYPRNAISSVTAAITAIESNAPMTVASGYEESGIETEGAVTGMRLGNSSRIETSAMTPKTIAGIAATAGDVVFSGELTGDFIALDAKTGKVLYRFNTGGPVGGGVVTYAVDRKQYVAVMSGQPSRFSVGRDPGAATVLVFAIGPH